ncbi:MAG: phosphotransferase [Clostridia bacterium]|nr:phosphotransferase [Clostridia bacterium]
MLEFKVKTLVDKGWSGDLKYCAETAEGEKFLLRIISSSKKQNIPQIFEIQKLLADRGVPMCEPVEYGTCEDGFYIVQTWIDGHDAEDVIPVLSESEQYSYGVQSGKILKIIHSVPSPEDIPVWENRFNAKIDRKIKIYNECSVKFDGAENILRYISENRSLLADRPQCFQHGDYHIGNMMVDSNGKLQIIDFDRFDFGDPWEEFNRIVWCAQKAPMFASGMVDGYFDGNVPEQFWRLLALYISSNTLSSVPWAIPFGDSEIKVMLDQAKEVLFWYENMNNTVPKWYKNNSLAY